MTFSKDIHAHLEEERQKKQQARVSPAEIVKQQAGAQGAGSRPKVENPPPHNGISRTKNYEMFGRLDTNRAVDRKHVNKLVREIRKKNLLHLNPIVVDGANNVIDGQHRLEAAKILREYIYYMQDDQVSQNDIAGLNSNKKNWAMMDYINFYASKGVPSYIQFREFCRKHRDIKPATLVSLCDSAGRRNAEAIQEGRLDISNIDFAEKLIGYVGDFQKYFPLSGSARFIEALSFISANAQYDHGRMISKVQGNPLALVPCANKKQYIQTLQGIYNRGVHEKNIVIFLKR